MKVSVARTADCKDFSITFPMYNNEDFYVSHTSHSLTLLNNAEKTAKMINAIATIIARMPDHQYSESYDTETDKYELVYSCDGETENVAGSKYVANPSDDKASDII